MYFSVKKYINLFTKWHNEVNDNITRNKVQQQNYRLKCKLYYTYIKFNGNVNDKRSYMRKNHFPCKSLPKRMNGFSKSSMNMYDNVNTIA